MKPLSARTKRLAAFHVFVNLTMVGLMVCFALVQNFPMAAICSVFVLIDWTRWGVLYWRATHDKNY